MPLTHEEITAIKNEVIAECKNIFVQIDECNTVQAENQKRFANDDKRIDRILLLQESQIEIGSIDIANEINYTRASVSRAVNLLKVKGYITIEKSKLVILFFD